MIALHLETRKTKTRLYFDYPGGIEGLLTLAGYLVLKTGVAVITTITVDNAHRRRGIARNVIRELESWLQSKGAIRVQGESTPGGLPFWKAMGYRVEYKKGAVFPTVWKRL